MAKNILICDDAAFMRMMIKDILTKNGYNIVGEAENGAKAVEKYAELGSSAIIRYYCYIPCTSTLLLATACHTFHTLYVLSFLICY